MSRPLFEAFDAGAPVVGGPFLPPTLFDPVPGNIGLIGDSVVLLHFTEPDGVFPSDAAGNLQDLGPDDDGDPSPASVECWAGRGRRFAIPSALVSPGDRSGANTLQLRDVSVQTIIAVRSAGFTGGTLIARGPDSSTDYGVRISYASGVVTLSSFWSDSSGDQADAGATYQHPGDSEFVLLTVTRRWNSTASLTFRYYAADHLLGETTSTNGGIVGSTASATSVGARLLDMSGDIDDYLSADIDELRVVDYEMSADEVRETWRRLSVHQPDGVTMFAGLTPPGSRWYQNPGNSIAAFVKTAGELVGLTIARTEELRANWLPDQAYTDFLTRWESVLGLVAKPLDSLDTRRARVISFLSRVRGYSIPALQQALSGPMALDPSDVAILQYANRITDDLSTLNTQRWLIGPTGTWSIVGGQLQIAAPNLTDLSQYPNAPAYVRTPVSRSKLNTSPFGAGAVVAQVELASITSLPTNQIAGLFLCDRVSNDAIWFGVKQVSGHQVLGYVLCQGNTIGSFTLLLNPAPSTPIWLRLQPQTLQDGSFEPLLGYSTTSATTGFTETTGTSFSLNPPTDAGVGVLGFATAAPLQVAFANFELIAYDGDRPFRWYAYRDPSLAGTPDIAGTQATIATAKPAHTYAAVTQNTSVLCDDPRDGLCDRGPCGGL